MASPQTLLPRSTLFNAALYGLSALIYTLALFIIETVRPGRYIFEPDSRWRPIFSNIAICSWPVLLFGALILIAVRIGAKVRRRRSKRKLRKKRAAAKAAQLAHLQHQTSATRPSATRRQQPPTASRKRSKSSGASGSLPRVPRGYVAVTRGQRLFAAFGFLWVSAGLALTAAAAAIVFVGQRERYRFSATVLGIDDASWKPWVIPLLTGGLPFLVYTFMSLNTLARFIGALTARGRHARRARAAARAVASERSVSHDDDEHPHIRNADFPMPPPPIGLSMGALPVQPDDATVQRQLQHLEDMGFRNRHQNIAALQASSFDLDVATQKLANTQM